MQKMLRFDVASGQHKQLDRPLPLGPLDWNGRSHRQGERNAPKGHAGFGQNDMAVSRKERGFKGSFSTVNAYVRQARIMARLDAGPGRHLLAEELESPALALQSPTPMSAR